MKYLIFILLSLSSQETLKNKETKSYYKVAPKLFEEVSESGGIYTQCPTPWKEITKSN